MNEVEFKKRTREVALRIIKLVDALPRSKSGDVIGRQILRSGTSIGANYRAACRGISTPDVIAKLGDVEEETDETLYWLELLWAGGIMPLRRLQSLIKEMEEILKMTVASIKTLKSKQRKSRISNPKSKIQNLKS